MAARHLSGVAAGMIITWLLTGCVDEKELKKNFQNMADKLEYQRARISAVEEACRQLHARLTALENQRGGGDSPVARPGVSAEKEGPAARFNSTDLPTESDIRIQAHGLPPDSLAAWMGKPDQVKESAGSQSWIYNSISMKKADGRPGSSGAIFVFENSKVDRVTFYEQVEYKTRAGDRPPQKPLRR